MKSDIANLYSFFVKLAIRYFLCSIGAGSTTLMHFLWGLSNYFLCDGLELSDMIMKRRSS